MLFTRQFDWFVMRLDTLITEASLHFALLFNQECVHEIKWNRIAVMTVDSSSAFYELSTARIGLFAKQSHVQHSNKQSRINKVE